MAWANAPLLSYLAAVPSSWTWAGLAAVPGTLVLLLLSGGPERFALASGALGSVYFLLGLAGAFRPGLLLAAALAAFAWALRRRDGGPWPGAPLAWAILAAALLHSLIKALAPPADADAMAYHLALPKLYLAAGELAHLPWLLFSHFPHLPNLLYALPLGAGWLTGPALLHWAAFAALLLAVYRFGREEFDERAGLAAAAVLAVQPALVDYAGTPRVEAWWALFHFLSFAHAWRWSRGGAGDEDARRHLWLAGAFAGFAAATKLMGAIPLAALGLWALRRPGGWRLLALGAALAAPWHLKTWARMGAPLWPFLGESYGANELLPLFLSMNRWPDGAGLAFLTRRGEPFLLVPLAAALGALWARGPAPGFLKLSALAFLPFAAVTAWNYEFWRYGAPFMPAAALAVAEGARRAGRVGWLMLAVAVFPLLGLRHSNELFAVLGPRSAARPDTPARELYLERSVPPYAVFRALNALPELRAPGAKLLLLPEDRAFYLDVAYQWSYPYFQGVLPFNRVSGPDELAARLREQGVSHILVGPDWRQGLTAPAAAHVESLLRALPPPTLARDGYFLLPFAYEPKRSRAR